jgi:hypothetical protein
MPRGLSEEQAAEARALFESTKNLPRLHEDRWTVRRLCERFDIGSTSTMHKVLKGETYPETTPPVDWHAEQVLADVDGLSNDTATKLADALADAVEGASDG